MADSPAQTEPIPSIRDQQAQRFKRLFGWSFLGSLMVVVAFYWTLPNIRLALSFLGLMTVMSGFLAAYYAMLRVER